MIYTGIDVSCKSFSVYAIDGRKKKVFEKEILPSRKALLKLMDEAGKEIKYVAIEAGNQLKWIADTLRKRKDVILHVVHPNELKWIIKSSGKTDKIDARKLAELARSEMLPRKVHIVDGDTRKIRELVSARNQIQSKRVSLINTIRGYSLQEGIKLPEKFFKRNDWQERLLETSMSETLKTIIEIFMASIEWLQGSEDELTRKLVEIEDTRIELVESIPCIGKISSRVIVGAIDDANRFDNKKAAASYGALTPRIYQSGDTRRLGRISSDGRHEIRKVLLQCAHTITRTKNLEAKPLRDFYERIENKRGKKKAVVALSRKLLTVAYGVMKHGEFYDPRELTPKAV